MRKLIKKILSLTLTALLIASTLVIGFSAYAAAPADSEAPYYDVDGKGIKSQDVQYPHQLKPVEQISNLDFENGFRFWAGGKDKGTYASTAFNIVTDGDNSYAKIPATGYVSNFQTALLKLEGVTAGDEIVIVYDVKGADGNKFRIKVEQEFVKSIAVYDETTGLNTTVKADGVTLINVTPGVPQVIVGTGAASSNFAADLTEGWTTLVTPSSKTLVDPSVGSAYTSDPIADAYYIKLWVTCGDSGVVAGNIVDAAIDNIRIAKVTKNSNDEKVYTNVVTGEVIYDPANPPLVNKAPKNLDFSNGFSYWKGETSIYSAVDGVLKTNDTYASGSWRWIKTEPFNVYNAVEGTTVELSFNVEFEDGLTSMDGNANQQPTLESDPSYKILDTYLADASIGEDDRRNASLDEKHSLRDKVSRNEVFYNEEGIVTLGPIVVEDPSQEFDFWISCGNSSKKTWEVTNITVTVTHPDGTVEVYPSEEEEPVEPEVPVVEPNPPKNLDFSDGFNYWAGETSIYSVENGVLKTNDTYTTGSWRWLKTESFNIPNAVVGTTVTLTFDVEFEDGLPSMSDHVDYQKYLDSTYGNKLLDTFFTDPTLGDMDRYSKCTESNKQRNEVYYNEEGTVTLGPITITDPAQEFAFYVGCGNSAKKTWEISNIVVTATHPDGTVDTYPPQPDKPEITADTLAWLMELVLANDVDDLTADFNGDKVVDLLDIVYVKKALAEMAVVD